MSRITIFVVATCVPGEPDPCYPNVFATEAEAIAFLETVMREEWEITEIEADDGNIIDYPGDWETAQQYFIEYRGRDWGRWELTSHNIEIETVTP